MDTDALSLYVRGDTQAAQVVRRLGIDTFTATVVTANKIMLGWQNLLRRAKNAPQEADAWRRYTNSLNALRIVTWLPLTESAIARYESLKKARLNVGMNDLRIAAIALHAGATVVTRNINDFRRVPELSVAPWSNTDAAGQEDF